MIWKNANGRQFDCVINIASMKRVKESLRLNLMECVSGDLMQKLSEDPCLLVDVLYVLHRPQCEMMGISDEQFGEGLFGDALDAASKAFTDALVEFFPTKQARLMRLAMDRAEREAEEAFRRAEEAIGSGSPPKISGGSASSAPESAE